MVKNAQTRGGSGVLLNDSVFDSLSVGYLKMI